MNAVIDPKEFDAAQAAAAKAAAAADPYTYTHKLQKPLDYEGKHYESLTFDWGKLTGNDSLAIEAELTALNQPVIIPSMSAGYLIRMACRACTEPIGVDVIGVHTTMAAYVPETNDLVAIVERAKRGETKPVAVFN